MVEINENELIRRVQKYGRSVVGDNAMEILKERYEGLVAKYAHAFSNYAYSFKEARAIGRDALYKAIMLFDTSKGFKLSTYATNWIISYIKRDKAKNTNIIQVPEKVLKLVIEVKSFIEDYRNKFGFRPSDEFIASNLKINKNKIKELSRINNQTLSLDNYVSSSDKEETFESSLVDSNCDINEQLIKIEEINTLYEYIDKYLNKREKYIIYHSLGLDNLEKDKLEDIAKVLRVSTVRVKQLKQAALNKLKQNKQYLNI